MSWASEMATPSLTIPAASLRLAGVIRLRVPSWSSFPHRPQLESSVINLSTSSFVMWCAGFSGTDGGAGDCAAEDCAFEDCAAAKAVAASPTTPSASLRLSDAARICLSSIVDLQIEKMNPYEIFLTPGPANGYGGDLSLPYFVTVTFTSWTTSSSPSSATARNQ